MAKGYKDLLAEAEAVVTSVTPAEAAALREDPGVVLVDIRDPRELEREGVIPGAFHAPRGMLEFWIDPESPYHKPVFAEEKTFVFFCAGGLRSLLAAKVAQEMGLKARSMREGFGGWKAAGLPIAEKAARG
ncbi:rhodanese-like domain-containing protein [Falsigemmobacter intermedius]|uniref:Rhodanese-like domain-containing protein n=1 Tax=Falsigemmobacter intermedius TaxID=1553448 RepID=A0A444MF57_9RHOB|nr:rhodanese-like domain-containing protein [Falsigemmobacter intermedius]RWY43633.1 rhodanese-like domain-containing protein [Falsigemmobacter intermedius]